MTTDRCSHTVSVLGDPESGRVSCWRPTYADSDRCIWHSEDGKSVSELARYDPTAGERLDGAVLRGLDFGGCDWLANCVLVGADFTAANVSDADLSDTDLRKSVFSDSIARRTDFQRANLERANFSECDLRGSDLRMARLDGTDLSGCRVTEKTSFGDRVVYETEMKRRTDEYARENALETATRTYGALERLSENNSLNAQASRYYRKAKDIRRQFNWRTNNYLSATVAEASRWFTGYGNRPWRVILTSVGVILLAGLVYPAIGGLRRASGSSEVVYSIGNLSGASLGQVGTAFLRGVYFSVITFTTLGYGNLEPTTTVGRYVAGVEALLGSILMALLVAVLTRSTWLR